LLLIHSRNNQKRSRSATNCSAPEIFRRFFPKIFFMRAMKSGKRGGRLWREQAGDDGLAPGDEDFLAFAEKGFERREAVAEVADGGFLHYDAF
jgi:hypothetical protein